MKGRRTMKSSETNKTLHYRGWTLVDKYRFKFANKDGTNIYRRVCRTNETHENAIRKFRAVVDNEEDGRQS